MTPAPACGGKKGGRRRSDSGAVIEMSRWHPPKRVDYFDYRDDMPVTCPACGWSGLAKETSVELYENVPVIDRECPGPVCFQIVLSMSYPTLAQTRAGAEAGNEEAIEMCRTQNIEFTPPPRRPH
jgi:hypothetical protein